MSSKQVINQNIQTPFIEGNQVTFLWKGRHAPRLIGDAWGWDDDNSGIELKESKPGLWTHRQTLPLNAYIEYHFWDGKQHILDPLNPNKTDNGFGGFNNFFYMPNAKPSSWTLPQKGISHGTVRRHVVRDENLVAGGKRTVILYNPPTDVPTPLLVVWDGQDYCRRGMLTTLLDNLIAQKKIRPIALAMVESAKQERFIEYACSETTNYFLMQHVLPLATRELNLISIKKNPGAYGVLGASMGGLMALYTGVRYPEVFGHVLSQSGAFIIWNDVPLLWELMEKNPRHQLKLWLDIGKYDFLRSANRKFKAFLRTNGYDFRFREYMGAHNYTSWRNDLPDGLIYHFGL